MARKSGGKNTPRRRDQNALTVPEPLRAELAQFKLHSPLMAATQKRIRETGRKLGLDRFDHLKKLPKPQPPSRKPPRSRKPGGGRKGALKPQEIRRGQDAYRRMLADPVWASGKQHEAAAKKLIDDLKLPASWQTVVRRIIEPVLKERQVTRQGAEPKKSK